MATANQELLGLNATDKSIAAECGCVLMRAGHDGKAVAFHYCPAHAATFALQKALEELLAVRPVPVKIPDTDMHLIVTYTKRDWDKIKAAQDIVRKAKQRSDTARQEQLAERETVEDRCACVCGCNRVVVTSLLCSECEEQAMTRPTGKHGVR